MLIIQLATLTALVIYAVDTRKMRKAAEAQIEVSQDLIGAASDQVEGLSKPCLTIWGDVRDGGEAIMATHGATGNIVAGAHAGSYVFHNIGNGVAVNIRYHFTRTDVIPNRERDWRYIPALMATGRVSLVETLNLYNMEHTVTITYDSNGGRHYRTVIELNHRVITSFGFEEVRS